MTGEQRGKGIVAQLGDLLALVAVHAAPDVDRLAARLGHLGQDDVERHLAIQRGGKDVAEAKRLARSSAGDQRDRRRDGERVEKLAAGYHGDKQAG